MNLPVCPACQKSVINDDQSIFRDEVYHSICLRCTTCALRLYQKTAHEFEHRPYCIRHWPRIEQSAILAKSIQMSRQGYISSNHRAVIYTDSRDTKSSCSTNERITKVLNSLSAKGIPVEQILMVPVAFGDANYNDLKKYYPHDNVQFPQIVIGSHRVGTFEDFESQDQFGIIDQKIAEKEIVPLKLFVQGMNSPQSSRSVSPAHELEPPSELQHARNPVDEEELLKNATELGYVDTWLNAAEWIVGGFASIAWNSVATVVSHAKPYAHAQPTDKDGQVTLEPTAPLELDPDEVRIGVKVPEQVEGATDFECIRTNWYWRHQKRLYRFTEHKWYRINPQHMIVKDIFEYNDVKSIVHTDAVNMIINFHSNKESQYIRTSRPDAITKFIQDHTKEPELIKVQLFT